MKLSDIKGEATIDVLAQLVVPIANISEDKDAADLFSRKPLPKGEDAKSFFAKRLKKSLPKLLANHKDDLVTIMAAISQVDKDEYLNNLNMATMLKDMIDLLSDEVFLQLFT